LYNPRERKQYYERPCIGVFGVNFFAEGLANVQYWRLVKGIAEVKKKKKKKKGNKNDPTG
jgi:hypothetical protein